MSNWATLNTDNIKGAGHGAIVDGARTQAVGSVDPVVQAIASVTAKIRRAVSAGNVLDADASKIPNSLVEMAVDLVLYKLMAKIGLALSKDQQDDKRDHNLELKSIAENRVRVETPDAPDASAEMQSQGPVVVGINVPCRQTGRRETSGL